jgi:hypothetical protein
VITPTGVDKVRWPVYPKGMLMENLLCSGRTIRKGAKTEGAFTDQVTHLIPLEPEGAEYKACSRPYTMLVVRLIRIRYTQFHPFTSVTLAMYEGWKAKTGSN